MNNQSIQYYSHDSHPSNVNPSTTILLLELNVNKFNEFPVEGLLRHRIVVNCDPFWEINWISSIINKMKIQMDKYQ